VTAEKETLRRYVLAKQGADLHTSSLAQLLAARFMLQHDLDSHIGRLCEVYRGRRNTMLAALDEYLPPEVHYTRPAGGLFLWVELPDGMGARELLSLALKERVAFVPGECFFPGGGHENTFRLNFSAMPEERIVEGVERLGRVLSQLMAFA
jgi:2-aminoadipate transaminase